MTEPISEGGWTLLAFLLVVGLAFLLALLVFWWGLHLA